MSSDEDQIMRERDAAIESCDKIVSLVGALLGDDFGDHSSSNEPWENCIEALECAAPRLITREQFDAEALAYANKLNEEMGIRTAYTLLTDARIGYDRLPPHLKADLHKRVGFEPVVMFRPMASPASGRADPKI